MELLVDLRRDRLQRAAGFVIVSAAQDL